MASEHQRLPWSGVPEAVNDAIAELLGARVVAAVNQAGGFSPGPAARCSLADGRVVFIKACGTDLNPIAVDFHRREAHVLASLPSDFPAPALLGAVDVGEWTALVTEWIEGRTPDGPLEPEDVTRFLALSARLAAHGRGVRPANVEPASRAMRFLWGNWSRIDERSEVELDPWTRAHLDELLDLERLAPAAIAGDTFLHVDLRADNVVFAATGAEHDVAIDWPHAAIGADWFPLMGSLPALALSGADDPWVVWGTQPLAAGADPDAVNAALAALGGYFTREASLPAPSGIPTLRAFQARQGAVTMEWLRRRIGD